MKSLVLALALMLAGRSLAIDCMRCHEHLSEDSASELFKSLRATHDLADNAIGIQNRGEVQNYTSNFGDMADFHVWHTEAMRWPSEASEVTQYCFGLGLIVATPGNVIESVMNSTSGLRDWSPLEGSLGTQFSGNLRADDDTPYMAHSHLPETWPEEGWPGMWREEYDFMPPGGPILNSPTHEVPGEFTSDGDTWAVFDDRNNPLGATGIEVRQLGMSYGRPYAQDHLFWRSRIYNRSPEHLDSVYVGYYVVFRPDYDYVDRIGTLNTRELDPADGGDNDIVYVWDVNGEADGAWSENETPMGLPALMVLESPNQMGVTDFHHFKADVKPVTDMEQWAVLSSQPDLLEEPELYFHSPGNNGRIDSVSDGQLNQAYGEGSRINFFLMTGPVSLAPGDSVTSSCAALLGETSVTAGDPDLDDLRENLADAWHMYKQYRYAGPGAPPVPELHGAALAGGARLWWEAGNSESAADFEGYRLYKSLDLGHSWGEEITDSQGNRVGWVPMASFDLEDGIEGPDPNGPTHLGRDTGLAYSYTDSGLALGQEVWYCLTAYSTGTDDPANDEHIPSLENPLGRSVLDSHLLAIQPLAAAQDHENLSGIHALEADNGYCDGQVLLDVLDPWTLPDASWSIELHEAAVGDSVSRFSLFNLDTGDTLLDRKRIDPEDATPFTVAGSFRLSLEDAMGGSDSLGWNEDSPCSFDWWMKDRTGLVNEYPEYVIGADDWRIRITEQDDTIPLSSHAYWYQGGDTTRYDPSLIEAPVQVNLRVERRAQDEDQWLDVSDWLISEDLRFGFPDLELLSPMGWDLVPGGLAGSRQRQGYETYTDALVFRSDGEIPAAGELLLKTNNFDWSLDANGDTLIGVAPEPGDVFTIITRKPFREGLRYTFQTAPPQQLTQAPPLKVRAVPDPYVAGHAAESGGERLFFNHVPAKCTLRIYTLAGDLVRKLERDDPASDVLEWDLRNRDRQLVAYGLYVFHVEDSQGREQTGRFMVIR